MLKVSKQELVNNVAFLHFLYLTKVNKERQYINRNGKMPIYEERNEPKKGYKSVCYITLRKFLESYLSKENKILKSKDVQEYRIQPKNSTNYMYGASPLIDSLVKIKLLNETGVDRNRVTDIENKNHNFSFNCDDLFQINNNPAFHIPYQLKYKFSFEDKEQIFIPVAFDEYTGLMQRTADCGVGPIKDSYANLLTKGLGKLKSENFLRRRVRVPNTGRQIAVQGTGIPVENTPTVDVSTSAGLATKYMIPKTILDKFIDSYKNNVRHSEGVLPGAIFEFTKNISASEHDRIVNLDFVDFENMAA